MTNKHVFFATTPSSDIDVLRNDAIKNAFKLQYLNNLLNKNKEDQAIRYRNWQLFFKKVAYLTLIMPVKKLATKKRRRRAKRLSNDRIEPSRYCFFKGIIKPIDKPPYHPIPAKTAFEYICTGINL